MPMDTIGTMGRDHLDRPPTNMTAWVLSFLAAVALIGFLVWSMTAGSG